MARPTKHAWGVFKRGYDPTFRGRSKLILISHHKSEIVAKQHAERHFPSYFVRRLTKKERV